MSGFGGLWLLRLFPYLFLFLVVMYVIKRLFKWLLATRQFYRSNSIFSISNRKNVNWFSEKFEMCLLKILSEKEGIIGAYKNEDGLIKFIFDEDKNILAYNSSDDLLFKGSHKLLGTKFTVNVIKSEIDSVNEGDKIVFYQVKQFPGWVVEIEESEDFTNQ